MHTGSHGGEKRPNKISRKVQRTLPNSQRHNAIYTHTHHDTGWLMSGGDLSQTLTSTQGIHPSVTTAVVTFESAQQTHTDGQL